ncbi:MAG: hypothetical protein PHW76_06925 [Alphaproteobacteria bacterium]|nr:hypothetical protein [Alphaproteobacteria bacterium]
MAELTHYRFNIAFFVKEAREKQRRTRRSLCGCSKLSPETLKIIGKTVAEVFPTIDSHGLSQENAALLLRRFEEMCRRQKVSVPLVAHAGALRLLISELAINAKALKANPNKLVPVTLYCGAIGPTLIRKFPDLAANTIGTIRHAVDKNPSDPEGFLTRYETTVACLGQLCADPTHPFRRFKDIPWIPRHIAIHNLSDPLKAMFSLIDRIDAYGKKSLDPNDEFHCFVHQPGIFTYAAIHHLKNMTKFLRRVKTNYEMLCSESEFAPLKKGFKMSVAIGYPNKAAEYLRAFLQGKGNDEEPPRPTGHPHTGKPVRKAAAPGLSPLAEEFSKAFGGLCLKKPNSYNL